MRVVGCKLLVHPTQIERVDRGQTTLFPECLEDWIGEDNPVRVVDVFVVTLLGLNMRDGLKMKGWHGRSVTFGTKG